MCPKCECPKCCGGRQPQYVVCLFAFARLSEKAAKLAAAAEQAKRRDEDEIEKVWDLANQPTCMLEPKRAT